MVSWEIMEVLGRVPDMSGAATAFFVRFWKKSGTYIYGCFFGMYIRGHQGSPEVGDLMGSGPKSWKVRSNQSQMPTVGFSFFGTMGHQTIRQ